MTIGKRKGFVTKGTGAEPGNAGLNNEAGGSLSKNDHWYLQQGYGMLVDPGAPSPGVIEATGGVTGEYTAPTGIIFKSHTFYNSGTFVVSELNEGSGAIEYLVVGGGGGGGGGLGGGGGAGGFRTNYGAVDTTASALSPNSHVGGTCVVLTGTYTVTVGGAGGGGNKNGPSSYAKGWTGGDSVLGSPTQPIIITSKGGGGGGSAFPGGSGGIWSAGWQGGSGGGESGMSSNSPGSAGATEPVTSTPAVPAPTTQGHVGGEGCLPNAFGGGGGGGAAGAGQNAPAPQAGIGGDGISIPMVSATAIKYAAGGTGGSDNPGRAAIDPIAGGGGTPPAGVGGTAAPGSGSGGGGGSGGGPNGGSGGTGGSGVVIVRYQIATTEETAKATGGSISYWDNPASPTGKTTIHVFLNSGTFNAPSP